MKPHDTAVRVTVPSLLNRKTKHQKRKISAITAYDFSFACILDRTSVDLILVGDSLGMVVQGHETTIPVSLEEMIYHCRAVTRGTKRALVIGDMPFLSYQVSVEEAVRNCGRMLKEGGVSAVKLEGGVNIAGTIRRLVEVDIPVMGHIGLTPQSFHRMGGFKVQGRDEAARGKGTKAQIIADAMAVEDAGAFALVVEGVPEELGAEITDRLKIPTIGIGAGRYTDGQILVLHDLLGLNVNHTPKFAKRYAELGEMVTQALGTYIQEVENHSFPEEKHTFNVRPKLSNAKAVLKIKEVGNE